LVATQAIRRTSRRCYKAKRIKKMLPIPGMETLFSTLAEHFISHMIQHEALDQIQEMLSGKSQPNVGKPTYSPLTGAASILAIPLAAINPRQPQTIQGLGSYVTGIASALKPLTLGASVTSLDKLRPRP
jgi:hypothetical protein